MEPIVDGLEAEFSEQLTVERLNAADPKNQELMLEFGVRGHPTFVIIGADGRVRQTFFGPQKAETLRAALTDVRTTPGKR